MNPLHIVQVLLDGDEDMASRLAHVAKMSGYWIATNRGGRHISPSGDLAAGPVLFTTAQKAKVMNDPRWDMVVWKRAPYDFVADYRGESYEDMLPALGKIATAPRLYYAYIINHRGKKEYVDMIGRAGPVPKAFNSKMKARCQSNPTWSSVKWEPAPVKVGEAYNFPDVGEQDKPEGWDSGEQEDIEPDAEMMRDVAMSGVDPVFGVMNALRTGTGIKRKITANEDNQCDLEIEVKPIGSAYAWKPEMRSSMMNIRWEKRDGYPYYSTLHNKGGGYFFVRSASFPVLEIALRELVRQAKTATVSRENMRDAYGQVVALRYRQPYKRGQRKASRYTDTGAYAYFR